MEEENNNFGKKKRKDIKINYKKINMTDTESYTSPEIYMGVVKWFNNKTGYGFITCLEKEYQHKDIFVHHSALIANNEQYKYLVQGEYVQFQIKHNPQSKHSISANNVTGILGGKLILYHRNSHSQHSENTNKKPRSMSIKN